MEKFEFDPVQARTYVINNRHNQVTAMYYLLQKKMEKEPIIEDLAEPAKRSIRDARETRKSEAETEKDKVKEPSDAEKEK